MYDVGGDPGRILTPTGCGWWNVNIINDTNITGNLSANLALSVPNGTDIFLLGGENIPLGAALGASQRRR